jgi:hypothetical protein
MKTGRSILGQREAWFFAAALAGFASLTGCTLPDLGGGQDDGDSSDDSSDDSAPFSPNSPTALYSPTTTNPAATVEEDPNAIDGFWNRTLSMAHYETEIAFGGIAGQPDDRVYMCEWNSPSAGLYKGTLSGETIEWDATHRLPAYDVVFPTTGNMSFVPQTAAREHLGQYIRGAWHSGKCGLSMRNGELVEDAAPASSSSPPAPNLGLNVNQINDFEFGGSTNASLSVFGAAAVGNVSINSQQPIAGQYDAFMQFTFTRTPGTFNEWINLKYATPSDAEFDLRTRARLVVSLRADRERLVRIRLASPVYDSEFGGVWAEFGVDVNVSTTVTTHDLPLALFTYPDFARQVWTGEQGWLDDAQALAAVRQHFNGLFFAPSATFDGAGEMVSSQELGYLHIDSIEFRN